MIPKIVEVKSKSQLRKFISFPDKLYADSQNYVPALRSGEFKTLGKKNPSLECGEIVLYLAYFDTQIVGRIAGIINHKANQKWNEPIIRFGWIDFIEDIDVARALLEAVEQWGKSKGLSKMMGPVGFNNMDRSGILVEGFEYLSPFTCSYNYPYYGEYLEKLGFEKDVDWTQSMMEIGEVVPERMVASTNILEQRYGFHIYKPRSHKELLKIGRNLFYVYNEAFANIHGATPLTERQIDFYMDSYSAIMNNKFVSFVVDKENNITGFAITVPSLSKAIRKAKGRIFPFGVIPILRALRHNDTLEALLIGILPKYQGLGLSAFLINYIHSNMKSIGIHKILSNPRLEDNYKAQNLFTKDYKETIFARRRCYKK